MWLETICRTTFGYECGACRSKIKPPTPGVPATSFGKKSLGFMVYLGGKKCVNADVAEIFTDMFGFAVSETHIWNARCAAADTCATDLGMAPRRWQPRPPRGMDLRRTASRRPQPSP